MQQDSDNVDMRHDQEAPQPWVGTHVYDVAGDKLGTVTRHDRLQSYFVMERGVLFHKDVFVPVDAIAGRHEDGIRLSVSKDDLRNVKWDQPPVSDIPLDDMAANEIPANDPSANGMPTTDDDLLGRNGMEPDEPADPLMR